ncbi:MAG: sugar ABC transporter permease [Firmicutes bacterium]|nr:sugar ABC transporter permease [Bacillota bacterium]
MFKKENQFGIYIILPALLLLGFLIIYPLINAIKLSFNSQMIYEATGRFIGLKNYINTLKDNSFFHSLSISFIWTTATVVIQIILGIIASVLLNESFKGRTLARALIILPFFMPTISVTHMMRWLFNSTYGLVNGMLLSMNLIDKPINWLGSSKLALITLIFIGVWRFFPFVVINVLARLQTIPPQLYEAARVDGANLFHELWYITLPAIKGVVMAVFLLRWIFMFKKFDIVYLLTGGGPGASTEVLPILAYRYAFEGMQLGKGSTISILIFIITLIFILTYLKVTANKGEV